MVDQTALKFNQAGIIVALSVAWLIEAPIIVALTGAVMLIGSALPGLALFVLINRTVVKPLGIVKPRPVPDREAPHRFAQAFGGIVVGAGYVSLLTGATAIGWSLVLLVVALALVNVLANFCAGCMIFYQLERFGVIPAHSEV